MNTAKTFEATKVTDYKFLKIDSSAFLQSEILPVKCTCEGKDVNPPLHVSSIPKEAKTLVIIVDDPDAPGGSFCHWALWNIPVTHQIKEDEKRGCNGMNDFKKQQYNGPCPPSGTHRYNFKVYALDCTLEIPGNSGKLQLEKAMADHIIGFGVLTGKYKKQNSSPR